MLRDSFGKVCSGHTSFASVQVEVEASPWEGTCTSWCDSIPGPYRSLVNNAQRPCARLGKVFSLGSDGLPSRSAWLVTTSKQLLLIARAMSFIAQTTGSGVGTVDGIAKSVRKEMKCCSQS